MDGLFSEPVQRLRLYAYTEVWPAERAILRSILNHLHSLGIEGSTGKEMVECEGEIIEMSYVEYVPLDDWTFCDIELLTSQISQMVSTSEPKQDVG